LSRPGWVPSSSGVGGYAKGSPSAPWRPPGFEVAAVFDDMPDKRGTQVMGVEVLRPLGSIPESPPTVPRLRRRRRQPGARAGRIPADRVGPSAWVQSRSTPGANVNPSGHGRGPGTLRSAPGRFVQPGADGSGGTFHHQQRRSVVEHGPESSARFSAPSRPASRLGGARWVRVGEGDPCLGVGTLGDPRDPHRIVVDGRGHGSVVVRDPARLGWFAYGSPGAARGP